MKNDPRVTLALADIPEGCSLQKAEGGQRFTCVRRGGDIQVLDDRCPHQGYPLSQGHAQDGVLTCKWHNWKFEAATGECTFGGEGVRHFSSVVEDGRVVVDVSIDVVQDEARLRRSMARALKEVDADAFLRDGLRLGDLLRPEGSVGRVGPAASQLAELGARRSPYGFDHPMATLADLSTWVARGWLEGPPALSVAATLFAETHANLPYRAEQAPGKEWSGLAEQLRDERRAEAEAGVRGAVRSGATEEALRDGLLPFLAGDLLDYGHGAIYVDKARTLWAIYPEVTEAVAASLTVRLGWATRETSLPPWSVTKGVLAEIDGLEGIGEALLGERRPGYEREVLATERRAAEATLAHLREGVAPAALLRASAHAAAVRVARFDDAWQRRLDANATVLGVTHALTFADSALALLDVASPRVAARLAVQAAAFVGKLRAADRDASAPEPESAPMALEDAMAARDASSAGAIARSAKRGERADIYRRLAPFAAYEAFVRPIMIAHAIKVVEAAHRLDAQDAEGDHAYLEAALTLLLPRRPERSALRAAEHAARMLTDGRPPARLY